MARALLLVVCLAACAAHAEDGAVDRGEVVSACTIETFGRSAQTMNREAVTAYCECAISLAAEVMTPNEYALLARYGVARANNTPTPSPEEISAARVLGCVPVRCASVQD